MWQYDDNNFYNINNNIVVNISNEKDAYLIFFAQFPMTLRWRTTKHAGEKGRERGGARRTTSRQTCLGSAEGGKIRINKIIMKIGKVEIWREESRGDIKEKTE